MEDTIKHTQSSRAGFQLVLWEFLWLLSEIPKCQVPCARCWAPFPLPAAPKASLASSSQRRRKSEGCIHKALSLGETGPTRHEADDILLIPGESDVPALRSCLEPHRDDFMSRANPSATQPARTLAHLEGCSCLAQLFPEEHSFLLLFPATEIFLALVQRWQCTCRACKVCPKPLKPSCGNPCGSTNAIPSVCQQNPSAASTGIPQICISITLVQT